MNDRQKLEEIQKRIEKIIELEKEGVKQDLTPSNLDDLGTQAAFAFYKFYKTRDKVISEMALNSESMDSNEVKAFVTSLDITEDVMDMLYKKCNLHERAIKTKLAEEKIKELLDDGFEEGEEHVHRRERTIN